MAFVGAKKFSEIYITLHVQCTSSTNHWLVPPVKTIEPVVANDMVIRKPRLHRQTGATQTRYASRPSKKSIRRTKSEFITTNTNKQDLSCP